MIKLAKEKQEINTFGKHKCSYCGNWVLESDFYKSNSDINKAIGIISVCKNCISLIFDDLFSKYNNEKIAMYKLCGVFNIPFYDKTYEGALETAKKRKMKVFQAYFSKINSFGDVNGYGQYFFEGEDLDKKLQQTNIFLISTGENVEISKDLLLKWGNLPPQDIQFLENEYIDWCRRYDVSSKAMEVNVKYICYQQLTINKKQEANQPVDKELKSLSDLMGNSALKPIQESAAMSAEFNTLGTWIKKFEQEEPFPEPDEELKDVDGFKKYIRVWFLGHMCKILGLDNEYSQEYDEELLKYTINFDESENNFDYNENNDEEKIDGDN